MQNISLVVYPAVLDFKTSFFSLALIRHFNQCLYADEAGNFRETVEEGGIFSQIKFWIYFFQI